MLKYAISQGIRLGPRIGPDPPLPSRRRRGPPPHAWRAGTAKGSRRGQRLQARRRRWRGAARRTPRSASRPGSLSAAAWGGSDLEGRSKPLLPRAAAAGPCLASALGARRPVRAGNAAITHTHTPILYIYIYIYIYITPWRWSRGTWRRW